MQKIIFITVIIFSIFAKDLKVKIPNSIAYGNMTLTTNNIFRGISYGAAIQGSMYIEHSSNISIGVWATSTEDSGTLLDYNLAHYLSFKSINIDYGVDLTQFTYGNIPDSTELYLGASYPSIVNFSAKVYYGLENKQYLSIFSLSKKISTLIVSTDYGDSPDAKFVSVTLKIDSFISSSMIAFVLNQELIKDTTSIAFYHSTNFY